MNPTPARVNAHMLASSGVLLTGLIACAIAAGLAETADEAFTRPAVILATSIGLMIVVEAQLGARNLFRLDIFMLGALYLLTFFEFLFPQVTISGLVSVQSAKAAVDASLVGFAGIIAGRHIFPLRQIRSSGERGGDLRPAQMTALLIATFFIGYANVLIAVNFDILEAIHQMQRPRFTQPWTRGRLGGISSLLTELSLLVYLIPPLAGAILAQYRRYNFVQIVVALAMLGFVMFEGFAGGTRNIFLTHLITLVTSYLLMQRDLRFSKVIGIVLPVSAVMWFAIFYFPVMRTVGLQNFDVSEFDERAVFVDMNLVNIALLTDAVPAKADYLGLEVPFVALVRPVPRAFWPEKPEGLSFGINEALNVGDDLTLSATFIGEMWLAGGYPAIAILALILGAVAGLWNRIGLVLKGNLGLILFASGFFPAGLCMRSFLGVAPALLPVIALGLLLYVRHRNPPRRKQHITQADTEAQFAHQNAGRIE